MKRIEKDEVFQISYDKTLESWVLWESHKSAKVEVGLIQVKDLRVLVEQSKKNLRKKENKNVFSK